MLPWSKSEDIDLKSLLSEDSPEFGGSGEKMQKCHPPSQFIPFCNVQRLFASVTIAITIGLLTYTTLKPHSKYSPDVFANSCGSTTEEAIAQGCKFDVFNYSWQLEECFDEQIYNRYWEKLQEGGPLKWYADANFTKELPQDLELLMHTPSVWSEHRYHLIHCMYSWELMHHALILNKPVIEALSGFLHTIHCANTILEEASKIKGVSIRASHNRCVMLP